MAEVRYFTPEEARAAVLEAKPLLAALRDAFHAYRFAKWQVDELVQDYGEDPGRVADHPAREEALRWRAEMEAGDAQVRALVLRLNALGADVKDPILGLIDFYARRADGETVLLCYRDDEDTVRFWHSLEAGFAGRRPLEELGPVEGEGTVKDR